MKKKLRRGLALLLCGLLLCGSALGYEPPRPGTVTDQMTEEAEMLFGIGLFRGTDRGFELERPATRLEGLVMLLRLLGEESAAQEEGLDHPFRDVPEWGDPYVGYALQQGLTVGTGPDTFGAEQAITLNDYSTFLLRALGYDDRAGDFSWSEAGEMAFFRGLTTEDPLMQEGEPPVFIRGDMAVMSARALRTDLKKSCKPLLQKLVEQGTITLEAAKKVPFWLPDVEPEASAGILSVTEYKLEHYFAAYPWKNSDILSGSVFEGYLDGNDAVFTLRLATKQGARSFQANILAGLIRIDTRTMTGQLTWTDDSTEPIDLTQW